MGSFARRFLVFIAVGAVLYFVAVKAYYYFSVPKTRNCCYVWGESTMCQDIDLDYLNKNMHYNFFSAAKHGAGVYDFLVFTQVVPENSKVFIGIGKTSIVRRKDKDYNRSGIDYESLYLLHENGYSLKELFSIFLNNHAPHQMFDNLNTLYPNTDSLQFGNEPLSLFQNIFGNRPNYLDNKENLFLYGIQTLIRKHCKIIAIDFPRHPILDAIIQQSAYLGKLDSFMNDVDVFFPKQEILDLDLDRTDFHDLTHLNEKGAEKLTQELVPFLDFKDTPTMISVQENNRANPK